MTPAFHLGRRASQKVGRGTPEDTQDARGKAGTDPTRAGLQPPAPNSRVHAPREKISGPHSVITLS